MNIIELFENAGIYKENATEFTFDDTVKVQKQFEIERSQNPNMDSSLVSNLNLAMKDYPKELLFISNNRVLYNFFSKKNHSRNRFNSDVVPSVSVDAIKSFISKFLSEDLDAFFEEKILKNKFDDVEDFLSVKDYLPQSSLDKLSQKLSDKFDSVLDTLEKNPTTVDTLSFNFIKHRSFYDLLSHFRSPENDEKIQKLLNLMSSMLVSFGIKTEFINPMMIAMGNYKAVDYNLVNLLKSNKDQTIANTQKVSSSGSSSISIGGGIVAIIIIIRLILLMARCNQ